MIISFILCKDSASRCEDALPSMLEECAVAEPVESVDDWEAKEAEDQVREVAEAETGWDQEA